MNNVEKGEKSLLLLSDPFLIFISLSINTLILEFSPTIFYYISTPHITSITAEVCLKSYFAPGSSPTTSIEPESVPKPDSKEPESVPKSDSVDTGSATKDTEVKDSIEPGSAPTDSISSIEPRPALTYSILFKTRNNNQGKT